MVASDGRCWDILPLEYEFVDRFILDALKNIRQPAVIMVLELKNGELGQGPQSSLMKSAQLGP